MFRAQRFRTHGRRSHIVKLFNVSNPAWMSANTARISASMPTSVVLALMWKIRSRAASLPVALKQLGDMPEQVLDCDWLHYRQTCPSLDGTAFFRIVVCRHCQNRRVLEACQASQLSYQLDA